ncbi:MAG TPA: metallophosphoesterase, partial [Bacteroidales bacterium]
SAGAGTLNDLLLFADNNGDDADIDVAQVEIFDIPLSAVEVTALGSVTPIPAAEDIHPYLENPTPTSMYISWQDNKTAVTKVLYNTDSLSFPLSQTGTNQDISGKIWNTVKLTGLIANTTYYYKCISGTDTSAIFPFHTTVLPGTTGSHIRFGILGDSQQHPEQSTKTANAMKAKFVELYGADWYNKVNVIMHTGDIIQNSDANEFETEYFVPFAGLSCSVPFMISAGNHEQNNAPDIFYQYVHYDDFSDVQYPNALCEKYYSFMMGNVQFLVTNSGGDTYCNTTQKDWIQQKLNASKDNTTIDFVFTFGHEAKSELWPNGSNMFVYNNIFPVFAEYPKVAMYSCGHTHSYEHGTYITNNSEQKDFRTVLFGGGGGTQDRWGSWPNQVDLRDVNKSFDYYGYVIVDVDMDNKSYTATAYSLGNPDRVMNNVAFDTWHGLTGRAAPAKPVATLPESPVTSDSPILIASGFIGADGDSLMSSQFQITATPGNFTSPLIDTVRHWVDVYGVNTSFVPINKNAGIDLTHLNVKTGILTSGHTYNWRARYRDHNCRWSEWSDPKSLTFSGTSIDVARDKDQIQIYPNPASTDITVNGKGILRVEILTIQSVCLKHYDVNGREDSKLSLSGISSGMYIIKIFTQKGEIIKNLIVR